jgi:hypothetical protein
MYIFSTDRLGIYKYQLLLRMTTLTRITHWVPRILCILPILLVSMFALDSFEPGRTIWQQLTAFLIHLIPSFVLLAALVVAWKWEKAGGIILIVLGIAFGIFIFRGNFRRLGDLWKSATIVMALAFPFFLSGILFLASNYLRKKEAETPPAGE